VFVIGSVNRSALSAASARLLCLCLTCGLTACGVSTDVYTRTLRERDQLRDRMGQVEMVSSAQQRQVGELQAALTEQQQVNHALQNRVNDLEAQTADQNLTQEALAQQLRSVTAEREELLLKLDELLASSPSTKSKGASSGTALQPPLRDVESLEQRLTSKLHDAVTAGQITVQPLAGGLILQLTESFLFVSDQAVLTAEGQLLLSTVTATLAGGRHPSVRIRMGVRDAGNGPLSDQGSRARLSVLNHGMVLARQLRATALGVPEVALVPAPEDGASTQASSTESTAIRAGEIQVILEWPAGP